MNNCHIGLSTDNEIVVTRKHDTGETVMVISDNSHIMVSFASNEHPSKGWRKFIGVKFTPIKDIFELFNKEQ